MLRLREMRLLNKKECSFDISPGEWLLITGPNGVGKSLLLKSLARIIPSEWSELSLQGKNTNEYSIEEWRSNLLYLPPEVVFDSDMSVGEFLDEPFALQCYKSFQKTFDPKKYWENLTRPMTELSSGQKQQVALLRALSLNPKILLLDEPFGYMDEASRQRFIQLLSDWITPERALILVSHIEFENLSSKLRRFAL